MEEQRLKEVKTLEELDTEGFTFVEDLAVQKVKRDLLVIYRAIDNSDPSTKYQLKKFVNIE